MAEEPTQTGQQPDEEPKSWLSARVEPFWVNPATIKGTVAILFGLFVMLAPGATLTIFRVGMGIALIVSGGSDLWFNRRREAGGSRLGEGLLSIGVGIVLVAFPRLSFAALLILFAGYLFVRGLTALSGAWRRRHDGTWVGPTVRGGLYLAAGGAVLLVPEGLLAGIAITTATGAFVLGGIMLAYGLQYRDEGDLIDIDAATVSQIIRDWINSRDVGSAKRARIGDTLFFEEPERVHKLTSWWVMLLLSVAIATFAVLQDSTAVVIGAMLIAPLMTPIMGTAAGIVNGWNARVLHSLGMVAAGVGAGIALAFILAIWVPALVPLDANSQVTSRVSPTLVDMLIALAAGAAGAYATVDDRVSSSITGVAIAVALVPPLAVVGITLEAGRTDDALGAFLLFSTNLVSIILAGVLVLYLTGFAPFQRFMEHRDQILTALATVAAAAIVILIPLVFTAEGILISASRQASAQTVVEEWTSGFEDLRVVRVDVDGERVDVFLSGREEPDQIEMSVGALEDDLSEEFGTPVTVVVEFAPTILVEYSDAEGVERSG